MNVAHYLQKGGSSDAALQVLGDGIAVLRLHGNATLEGALCGAQAFFAFGSDKLELAEEAIGRALEISERDSNPERQLALLELSVEVALATQDPDRITERRMALAKRYVADGQSTAAVEVLIADLSEPKASGGAVISALRDVLGDRPLNSHPVHWFSAVIGRVAKAGHLAEATEWLNERLGMERGADRAHLLVVRSELAIAEGDVPTADAALFEAIHIGQLCGIEERKNWIARHRELAN